MPNNGHVHSSSRDTGDTRDKEGWGILVKLSSSLQCMKTIFYRCLQRAGAQFREVQHPLFQQSHWYCPGDSMAIQTGKVADT